MDKIVVDVGSNKKPIDPMIYSNFIEHLGKSIKDGLWTYEDVNVPLVKGNPFLVGVREDVLEAVKKMNVSVLRAFGGCYSDVYHWKDAIGPRDQRKRVRNKQWSRFPYILYKGLGGKIANQFGTDEFCHFCEAIGAEPYLNINYSTGTLEEAAQWVEYCNGSTDTEYGALRAKNGREKPYNVKYWGIANEIWGPQEKGWTRHPENYAKKYLPFAKAMRERDPSIKLVAVGWHKSQWNQTVVKLIGEENVDLLSIHRYVPLTIGGLINLFSKKHKTKRKSYYSLMGAYRSIERDINNTWEDIATALGKDTHVGITFDEWGIWYRPADLVKTKFNMQDGICTADILLTFQRMSDKCPMANWAQLINCIGTILTDKDGIILTPVYHVFDMLTNYAQPLLIENTVVECDTFNSKRWGMVKKAKNVPYINCNATISEDGKNLSIIVINKHFSEGSDIKIIVENFIPSENGMVVMLNSDSPFDQNTEDNRNKLQIVKTEISNVGLETSINFPPHSVSIIKMTSK